MNYSQRDEQTVILAHFGDTQGRFLDVGSYDAWTFSNIRALNDRGWTGTCVEPSAAAFAAMLDNPPEATRMVNALVGPRTGLASFLHSKDAVSTTERAHAKRWSGAVTYTPVFVGSVTVTDLLQECPGPYNFLSIDTEGTSMWVLSQFIPLLDHLDTELVCVEHDGAEALIPGWMQVYKSPENLILRRK